MIATAGFEDRQTDAVAIGEDGGVPEAQHPKALSLKVGGSALIIGGLIRMLSAIDLNDQGGVSAIEVDDVGAARNLALPPPATEAAITQRTPKARFGFCVLTTQTAGAVPLCRVPDGSNLGHVGMVSHGWTTLQVVVRSRPSPYPLPSRFASGKRRD
jgi:hypothetical protein